MYVLTTQVPGSSHVLHGLTNHIKKLFLHFVGEGSLLDDTVEHNYRTCSSNAAVDHCTHREASHNLEQTSESKKNVTVKQNFCNT